MKTNMALETLFHPFESGILSWPQNGAQALFLNAQRHKGLPADVTVQQGFKPYAQGLEAAGYAVYPDIPEALAHYDAALIAAPKNQTETLYLIARALKALKPGGLIVVAADNKAGGKRLAKNLEHFGLDDVRSESRNKARVCWAFPTSLDEGALQEATAAGAMQSIVDDRFQSQPGMFGWNKIDQGSQILLQHLPDNLKGRGADFGCGYGLLADHLLQNYELKSLACVDADWRATQACRINLEGFQTDTELVFEWADLTAKPSLSRLDFIVMNPPFHEGKTTDSGIGERFIASAAESLKPKGKLWMVANKQLAYEAPLEEHFFKVEKVFEGQGFKVFCAAK